MFVDGLSSLQFVSFAMFVSEQVTFASLQGLFWPGFFELIVLGYVETIFVLSIAVSLYWAENWKLSSALIFLRFSFVRSNKFRQKVVKLGRR